MPTRSLGSAPIKWPDRATVDAAFRRWAGEVLLQHHEILRIGYIGSYATGDWGVGSDLDVVIILATSDAPYGGRLLDITDDGLPVPADLLVYTVAEIEMMRAEGRRFVDVVDAAAVWL
jgi:uncharacterized protein